MTPKQFLLYCLLAIPAGMIAILAVMVFASGSIQARKFRSQRSIEADALRTATTNYYAEEDKHALFPRGVLEEEEIVELVVKLTSQSKIYFNPGSIEFSPEGVPLDPIGTPYAIEIRVSSAGDSALDVFVR
jgi:hypothetical protein